MAMKWISACKGVRYREHETRKHNKRPDKYYTLQYKRNGKVYNEPIGWASEGVTQARCEKALAELKENWRTGTGGQTLAEMREHNLEQIEQANAEKLQEKMLTLRGIFESGYLTSQIASNKKPSSIQHEKTMLDVYIEPFFQDMPLKKIDLEQIERFKVYLDDVTSIRTQKTLSDSSKRYILSLVSQIFNYALRSKKVDSSVQNPIRLLKKPRSDNKRERFLSVDEANTLLEALNAKSLNTHDMALLSLFCGLRAGEITSLTWADVNFTEKTLSIKDPKNTKNRYAFMTIEIESMLKARYTGQEMNKRIFNNVEVSRTFERVVASLGLNDGRDDRRDRVVFHTLRHTFASWHVQRGTPIYTLSKLMGHSSLRMTERYSHLSPNAEKLAVLTLQGALQPQQANIIKFDKAK